MNQSFTIFSGFFLATSLVSCFVALLALQRKSVKGAKELSWLMMAAGLGAFFLIFETAATSAIQKIFWAKLEYIGGAATPVLYLIFVLRFAGFDKFLTRKNILVMFVFPAISLLLAMTNEKHNLFWSGFSEIYGKTNLMEYYHGMGFWIFYLAYSYVLLVLATIFLFRYIIRNTQPFRLKGWIIFIGCMCPWFASVLYLTGLNPVPGLDLVPISIILSGILMVYAILYYQFLDFVPIARETLVETMTDGIMALDEQNQIQDINEAAMVFLGITNRNIIGQTARPSQASASWLLEAIINQASGSTIEIKSNTKTYRILKQPIKKQVGSNLIVIQDITEQVARQLEILKAEARYHNMFTMFRLMSDNMSDMIWAKDLQKRYIFVNKAVCDHLLFTKDTDEPIGKEYQFFVERERQNKPEQPDWYSFGQQSSDSDQIVMNSKQAEHFDEYGNVRGKLLHLDVWRAPIFNEGGEMIGVVGSGRDVTLHKKAIDDLYKRDLLLDAIARATALLVTGENLEKCINGALKIVGQAVGANRVYIFQNHSALGYRLPLMSQMYEWSDDSVDPQIDNPLMQNIPYETSDPRLFETLSAGKVISGKTCEFPEAEKGVFEGQGIKSILLTPVILDSVFWGYLGFDDCTNERDWTATEQQILNAAANTIGAAYLRKKNQDELIAAKEKSEESDRLKSAFLANMSHEIRTPMNGILGFAELLKEPDLTGDEHDAYIEIIEKSGIRMLAIINDLVDISKIESGQMEVKISETNINDQVDYIFDFFRPAVESKGIRLSMIRNLSGREALISTDREKLNAILVNLVKNAVKFTIEGSIEFGYEKKGDYLEYFVKDTGIGIGSDHQESIFNRFVQADIANKQNMQGAGLGLSIAKAFVEMLGGQIWVESQEFVGSSFYFTIPYQSLLLTA
ncbi:MAG: histidine kinase N-terminal 7TM domain-containing protein [Bacteroidales bacterium]|jgi:signal transduction histidine kinase/PAS domain-containing protein